jgi:hypothetical protein
MMGLQRYGLVLAGLMILALVLVAPVSAAVVTIDNTSATAISDAINAALSGDIIILNPGIYFEHGMSTPRDITIQANTTHGGDRTNTIIDAMQADRIFDNSVGHALIIDNLTLRNGTAYLGGAIYNTGTLIITSSTLSGCTASYGGSILNNGGAIYNNGGTVTVTTTTISGCTAIYYGGAIENYFGTVTISSSTISGCSATNEGGAIDNYHGTATITTTTISDCTATYGGAIDNYRGTATITSSTISGCSAGNGGAIYNFDGPVTIHFSRIYHCNTPGTAVENYLGSIDAENNWWGSNAEPSGSVSGAVTYTPWLLLGITATPPSISPADTSAIRTNLTFNSTGHDTSALGHLPDGITNLFAIESGSGSVLSLTDGTVSGVAGTTFTPASSGTTVINGTVDDQSVYSELPVTFPAPTVTGITPNTGLNISAVSITSLAGSGFQTGAAVLLMRAGHANITATGVTVVSPAQITVTLPITYAGAGAWDVVVINPDGQEAVLPGGFTITSPGSPTTTPTSTPPGTGETLSDFPSSPTNPLMTVTVNIGGDSKAWQAIVTGTKLTDLIVTGTVQPGSGSNMSAPPGVIFQYISLIPARYNTITNAVINFTVPQSWLDENHITPGSIVLYHQTANGWEALPTTMLYTKDGTLYLSAQSNGFSLFAIAGTPTVLTPPVAAPAPEIVSTPVQEQTPAPAPSLKAPVTMQTTALPATTPQPSAPSPLLNIVLVIAAIGVLAGGGFMVRRWWIRRQNPALFAEYE